MIKSLLFLIVLGIIVCPTELSSQELSTSSRKAKKAFEEAEQFYMHQEYDRAIALFSEAVTHDANFFEAWVMLGETNMQLENDSLAVDAYKRAIAIDPVKYPAAYYFVANLEFGNGWYADALDHYIRYLELNKTTRKGKIEALKNIENCKFALQALKHPVPFDPVNLGKTVNSPLNEYFPCLTADNQTLLFTRLLNDKASFTGRQEDFFISAQADGKWLPAQNLGKPINTFYNEGAPTLTADGRTLVFTACESVNGYGDDREGYGRCDLFLSSKSGLHWSKPENIMAPVNSRYWESQPSLSADGRSLYFVSNRDEGYDIFMSEKDDQGKWLKPVMLNGNINTPGYEGSVFIHPDNQTLYFSSDGHVGMGGMDIFVSRRDSTGDWGPAENLGYPINTHKDENSILVSADGQLAMFASDREEGFGGLDLYGFELYEEAKPVLVTFMKGKVFDAETNQKLGAEFELIDLANGELVVNSYSDPVTGEFLVSLPSNRVYALNVSRKGYLFYSENFDFSGKFSVVEPYVKDIPLQPIKAGKNVVLKNIFFETDKYVLKEESKVELMKLVEFLETNPTVKIEISGHTDNVGGIEYNQQLSENRAKAVNDYLVGQAIGQERLIYKGYGESSAIESNETTKGRAANRRTEFKILK